MTAATIAHKSDQQNVHGISNCIGIWYTINMRRSQMCLPHAKLLQGIQKNKTCPPTKGAKSDWIEIIEREN